jgi:hypothetical protein
MLRAVEPDHDLGSASKKGEVDMNMIRKGQVQVWTKEI